MVAHDALHDLGRQHRRPPQPYPGRALRGETFTGAFARKVARQYRYYASVSKSPTKALAEASEVPMSTARWWIREARRLGELPPGRKGKVG